MTLLATVRRVLWSGGIAVGIVTLGIGLAGRAPAVRTVDMLDRCDPASFNAAFGPGTCVFDHPGVTVDTFLNVLERAHTMGAWHFAPTQLHLKAGQAFQAQNSGGEFHTFTEVDEFGGGFIADLNELTGDTEPAPECLNIAGLEFIAPGDTSDPEIEPAGTHKYMCCIHPWMRTTVTVR